MEFIVLIFGLMLDFFVVDPITDGTTSIYAFESESQSVFPTTASLWLVAVGTFPFDTAVINATPMSNLTLRNLNKKQENGEYIWSEKDVFKHNQKMKKEKKPKQVIWRCACNDDQNTCLRGRGLILMRNYNDHVINMHRDGDKKKFDEEHRCNLEYHYIVYDFWKKEMLWVSAIKQTGRRRTRKEMEADSEVQQQVTTADAAGSANADPVANAAPPTSADIVFDQSKGGSCIVIRPGMEMIVKMEDGGEIKLDTKKIKELLDKSNEYDVLQDKKSEKKAKVMTMDRYDGQIIQYGLSLVTVNGMSNVECKYCELNVLDKDFNWNVVRERKNTIRNVKYHIKRDGNHFIARHGSDKYHEARQIWMTLSREFIDMFIDGKVYSTWTRRVYELYKMGLNIGNKCHSEKAPDQFLAELHHAVKCYNA